MTGNPETSATIGRYQLIAEIGRGGMSTVYLAITRGMAGFDKLFVVKVLRETCSQPEEMTQFMSEAQLAARLNHPNVVQSHEVGEDSGRYFIAMEYLDGQPLSRVGRPATAGAFPLPLHLRALSDVLSALHYAHELADYDGKTLGIVHRDVSPQNVFITYDGVVKLLDFGIAKSTVIASEETRTGIIKGKIGYLAPEQLTSGRTTQRVDIFAVGLMLWEAITGRRVWEGLTEYDILLQLARREVPSPKAICPDLPAQLVEICDKALRPEPEERFASALEFRTALDDYVSSFTSKANSAALAKHMAERFGEERKKMRALIKQRLAALQTGGSSESALAIALPTLSGIRLDPTATGSRKFAKQTTSSRYTLASDSAASATPQRSKMRRNLAIFATAAAMLATAVVASRRRPAGAAAAPAAAPAPVVAAVATQVLRAPPPPPEPAREGQPASEIRLSASPSEARMFLDNAPLPENPYVVRLARNSIAHHLRVEAPGYTTRTELVSFESDRAINIDLSKPAAVVVPRRAAAPHGPPPQAARARGNDLPPPSPEPVAPSVAAAPEPAPRPAPAAVDHMREIDESVPFKAAKRIDESNPFR